MVKCIWCGEEIEGSIRDHLAQKHIGENKKETPQVAPTPAITQKNTTPNTTTKDTPTLPLEKEIPKSLNTEKPKKRYLNADEIITLLQNTNKRFMSNELAGCPLTKTDD